jgi:hypothetical protein
MDGEPGKAVGAAAHGQALAQRGGGRGDAVGRERFGSQHRNEAVVGNAKQLGPIGGKVTVKLFREDALLVFARPNGADGGRIPHRLPSGGGLAQAEDKFYPTDKRDRFAWCKLAEWIATSG